MDFDVTWRAMVDGCSLLELETVNFVARRHWMRQNV